jgi:hypothetical protein
MPTPWRKERVLDSEDERTGRLQEVAAQREKLNTWIEILARHEKRIDTDNEVELIVTNHGLNEPVNHLNVREVATTGSRTLNELLARLERYNLKSSLAKVARKVPGTTSDLKNSRARWELKRTNKRTSEWGHVIPKLLKDSSLH